MTKQIFQYVLRICREVKTGWQIFENHKVLLKDPLESNKGSRLIMDPLGFSSCVSMVPWYAFCCLECKNITKIANFLRGANLPPLFWWRILRHPSGEGQVELSQFHMTCSNYPVPNDLPKWTCLDSTCADLICPNLTSSDLISSDLISSDLISSDLTFPG